MSFGKRESSEGDGEKGRLAEREGKPWRSSPELPHRERRLLGVHDRERREGLRERGGEDEKWWAFAHVESPRTGLSSPFFFLLILVGELSFIPLIKRVKNPFCP